MTTGILLSGGIDSIALAKWKTPQVALTIDYGQLPAQGEIRAARKIAEELGLAHEVLTIDCRLLGSGDLAGVPATTLAPAPEWWPFRNQLLLTIAAARAVALGIEHLFFGSVASDGFHADGRPEFFKSIDSLTSMQEGGIRISAPAIAMTSVELIRISGIKPSLLAWAHSCHKEDFACGGCQGCFKHQAVMSKSEQG